MPPNSGVGALGEAATAALIVGGIVTVIGFAGWWVYGLILGLATLLIFGLFRGRWFRFSLFPRLPYWLAGPLEDRCPGHARRRIAGVACSDPSHR